MTTPRLGRSGPPSEALNLRGDVQVRLGHVDGDGGLKELDARLLFLGPRAGRLEAAYARAATVFSSQADPAALHRALDSDPVIREFYVATDGDDGPSIVMRQQVFAEPGPSDAFNLRLTMKGGRQVYTCPIPLDRLPALGTLCGLLGRSLAEAELRALLLAKLDGDAAAWAQGVLAGMVDSGVVTRHERRASRLGSRSPLPRVDFLGHASVLFRTATTAVVVDPFVRPDAGGVLRGSDLTGIPLAAVCCSHAHWDHCNPATLLLVDKDVPVIVPRVARPSVFNPPVESVVRSLGFTEVRAVGPGEPVAIGDVEVVPVPFHGEQDEPGVEIDHFTYVIRTANFSLYGGADCYRDSFGDMEPVMADVARRYSPDVAFLPISEVKASYRDGGVSGFCRFLDRERLGQTFQYTSGPEDSARWAELLGSPLVVPYAGFALGRWEYPDALAAFRRALQSRGLEGRLQPLRPLDSVTQADLTESTASRLRSQVRLGAASAAVLATKHGRRGWRRVRRLVEGGPAPTPQRH